MKGAESRWRQPDPVRGGLADRRLGDADVWSDRVRSDRQIVAGDEPRGIASITSAVEERSRELEARALILTGSTARNRRTAISDLDYHVIGRRPLVENLAEEIDLYSDSPDQFIAKLRAGDDFVHWSVWYGRVLFDDGTVQAAAKHLAAHDAWPDPARKLAQAQRALPFAEQLVESQDHDAALERVRGVLSLTARWMLLAHDVFPLSRDELSDQVLDLGCFDLAAALHRSIHAVPSLDELATGVRLCGHLTSLSPTKACTAGLPAPA